MRSSLDRIDFDIVGFLQKNAQMSNKELAAAVGLAESTCLHRVERLREMNVLGGAHAEVSPDALGITLQALVAIRLRQHSRDKVQAFWAHLESLPEVLAMYHVTGAYDFHLHVALRDTRHLRDFILDSLSARGEVGHIETSLIVNFARNFIMPNFVPQEVEAPKRSMRTPGSP